MRLKGTQLIKSVQKNAPGYIRKYTPKVLSIAKTYGGPNVGLAIRTAEKLVNIGNTFHHTLKMGESETKMFGATIDAKGVGAITRSKYKASYKNKTKAISSTMLAAQRMAFNTVCAYRCTNTATADTQAAFDMTSYPNTNTKPWAAGVMFGGQTSNTAVSPMLAIQDQIYPIATQQAQYIYFDSVEMKTIITNASTVSIFVDLYECVSKLDYRAAALANAMSPVTDWASGYTQSANNIAAVTGGAIPTPSNLGSRPTDSAIFNTYWKICSKHTVELSVGSSHEHSSLYEYHKLLEQSRYGSDLGTYQNLGGLTRTIMCVIRGTLARDQTTSTNIATAPVVAFVEHIISYRSRAFTPSSKIMQFSDTSTAIVTPEVVTVATAVNIGLTAIDPA